MKLALAILALALLAPSLTSREKPQVFYIQIPEYFKGADFVKVYGDSRVDALASSGLLVATEEEWTRAMSLMKGHKFIVKERNQQ